MAKINPQVFSWTAPTLNIDGSPVVGVLNYTLQIDSVDFLSFPGSLNANGNYEEQTLNMNLPVGAFQITLTAFYVDEPTLVSDPSNAVDVITGVTQPEVPLALQAS